jgi:hypothetical protein
MMMSSSRFDIGGGGGGDGGRMGIVDGPDVL